MRRLTLPRSDQAHAISDNPYRLARDIRGIGFRTADQIFMKVGIDKDAMIRIRAGVSYGLAEAMDEGIAVCRRTSSSSSRPLIEESDARIARGPDRHHIGPACQIGTSGRLHRLTIVSERL